MLFQIKYPKRLCNTHLWSRHLHVYLGAFVSEVLWLLDRKILRTHLSEIFLNLDDGADRLYRDVGKALPL